MSKYNQPLEKLISELSKLPGIGRKSAQRLAFFLMRQPAEEVQRLIQAITEVKEKIIYCSLCNNITEKDPCSICSDLQRDKSKICIVEDPSGLLTVEKTNEYRGLYHVLLGALSHLEYADEVTMAKAMEGRREL